jgi:hypothetical protein
MFSFKHVLVLLLPLLLAGCFTSIDPIFDDSQIVEDPRIEGRFLNQDSQGRPQKTGWLISRSGDFAKRYEVTVDDGPARMQLIGTLFRLDGTLFLDLYPRQDSGVRHEPAGAPTETEMLHSAVYEQRHLIWKVELSDSELTYSFPTRNGAARALTPDAPDLQANVRRQGELAIVLLPRDKKKAQDYLKKFASDPKIFDYKAKLVKKP